MTIIPSAAAASLTNGQTANDDRRNVNDKFNLTIYADENRFFEVGEVKIISVLRWSTLAPKEMSRNAEQHWGGMIGGKDVNDC